MPAILPAIVLKVGSLVEVHGYHFYERHDFVLTAIITEMDPEPCDHVQGVFVEIVGGRAVTCNPIEDTTPSGAWVYPHACWPLSN
jgi:hypothetical protein